MENPTINLALRNQYKGLYTVNVRYYVTKEEYIPTSHKISREDWEAPAPKRGEGSQGYQRAEAIRQDLGPKIKAALQLCGSDVTYERFKAAFGGKKLNSDRTWITLLDMHLKLNQEGPVKKRYTLGTIELYQFTRSVLVGVEAAGKDVCVENYTTVKHYQDLEQWMAYTPYVDKKGALVHRQMGNTTLSMHMQNIKAIARTGYNPETKICWIPNDSFTRYQKPQREEGTDPNTFEDFIRIKNFTLDQIPVNKYSGSNVISKQRESYKWGRDFWCLMLIAGGMEARNIAELRWPDVFPMKGNFRYVRTKTAKSSSDYIWVSMKDEHVKYMFEEYSVTANMAIGSYVFPILRDGMSDNEKESAIKAFYERISEYVRKIGKKLEITPLPNCKRVRPSFACEAIESGMDLHQVKISLGHKKISTTEIYVKNLPVAFKVGVSEGFADHLSKKRQELEQQQLQKAS